MKPLFPGRILGDLVDFQPSIKLRKGDEYPFIPMENIIPGTKSVCSHEKKKWTGGGAKFDKNDILFARITPCLENRKIAVARVSSSGFGSTEFFVLRAKPGKIDQQFLYYLSITDLLVANAINSYTGASGRQRAEAKFLKRVELNIPNISTQKKIAAVLSAYDDLIENNNRRIALLEKMAEEIYREWFVRMRFPGHEKTQFKKGIPEGWKLKPFCDVVKIRPAGSIDKNEAHPFVGMEDLSLSSMMFTHKELRTGNSGSKFRNGDTLFPRITPCLENGKRGYVMCLADGQIGFGSTEFIVMREAELSSEHIYLLTISSEFRKHAELSMTGASGRQRVQEDCFGFFLVKTPPQNIAIKFSEAVRPMFSQIKVLYDEVNILEKTRDRLLTRLISGKLSVEELEIEFPSGMEGK